MKETSRQRWLKRIEKFKEIGAVPEGFNTPEQLARFLETIDPFLVLSHYAIIHELLGKKRKRVNGEWQEVQRYRLPMKKARELMVNDEYKKLQTKIYQENFGDENERIRMKSLIMLEKMIDEGDRDMVKVGLEKTGEWTRGLKVTRVDDTKKTKKIVEEVKKALELARIKQKIKDMDGNH